MLTANEEGVTTVHRCPHESGGSVIGCLLTLLLLVDRLEEFRCVYNKQYDLINHLYVDSIHYHLEKEIEYKHILVQIDYSNIPLCPLILYNYEKERHFKENIQYYFTTLHNNYKILQELNKSHYHYDLLWKFVEKKEKLLLSELDHDDSHNRYMQLLNDRYLLNVNHLNEGEGNNIDSIYRYIPSQKNENKFLIENNEMKLSYNIFEIMKQNFPPELSFLSNKLILSLLLSFISFIHTLPIDKKRFQSPLHRFLYQKIISKLFSYPTTSMHRLARFLRRSINELKPLQHSLFLISLIIYLRILKVNEIISNCFLIPSQISYTHLTFSKFLFDHLDENKLFFLYSQMIQVINQFNFFFTYSSVLYYISFHFIILLSISKSIYFILILLITELILFIRFLTKSSEFFI
ncbi:hypothetical protein SNEBB_005911 [Seison nebaliae]|nr:hypothetical protein SNEBB_005911 [Seison nebaliae]